MSKEEEKAVRVAICVPSGDFIHTDFALSLINLISYSRGQGIDIGLINQKTSHIDIGRHALVKAAQQIEADYVLFLDSDMVFPFNTLERLLRHGTNIVGVSYIKRREPFCFTHTDIGGGCHEFNYGIAALSNAGAGLREVSRLPTGCMLINMDVFKVVPEPWFDSRWNEKSGQRISEDNAFCDDARRLGFSIWLDEILTGEVGHIGQTVYRPEPIKPEGMTEIPINIEAVNNG